MALSLRHGGHSLQSFKREHTANQALNHHEYHPPKPTFKVHMPTFAEQLKSEIARIARKESRADSKQVKKASAQYRAEIAALKRRMVSLESSLARLLKQQASHKTQDSVKQKETVALRFRTAGFASLRKKLGLTAHEMAQLIGVSAQSVYHWEAGKSRPRASQLPAIAAVRKLSKKEAWEKLAS